MYCYFIMSEIDTQEEIKESEPIEESPNEEQFDKVVFFDNMDDNEIEQYLRTLSHEELLRFDHIMDLVLDAPTESDEEIDGLSEDLISIKNEENEESD